MAGDRQDCDRRGADRGGGGLLLLWERDVIKQQLRQGNQNTDEQSKCCIGKDGKDMEKQWLQRRHKGPTIRVHSAEHTTIRSRDMANHSGKWQETGGGASQMAEEDITCHMEGQNNKQGNQGKNRTGGAPSEGKDLRGWVMWPE